MDVFANLQRVFKMETTYCNPIESLWSLYARPGGMTCTQLFGLIERASQENAVDLRTRQLMHEGLRAITSVMGLSSSRALVRGSSQRESLERIRSESFPSLAFPDLLERVTLVEAWQVIRTFLAGIDGALGLYGPRWARHRATGLRPPEAKIDVCLGGGAALMAAKRLTRRVSIVDHAGPLSKQLDAYRSVLASHFRREPQVTWSERVDFLVSAVHRGRLSYLHGYEHLCVAVLDPIDAFASLFFTTDPRDQIDIAWTEQRPDLSLLRHVVRDIARADLSRSARESARQRWKAFTGEDALPV